MRLKDFVKKNVLLEDLSGSAEKLHLKYFDMNKRKFKGSLVGIGKGKNEIFAYFEKKDDFMERFPSEIDGYRINKKFSGKFSVETG